MIRITYGTSFPMRRAAGIIILRLPLNMSVMIDPPHIWNVIHNAGGSKNKPPTWLDFAPATQKIVTSDPSFPMRRVAGIILAPHQILCVCHARWMAWLTLLTYETSFKMGRKTRINPDLIKYCACHGTLQSQILQNFTGNSWSSISNVRPIGAWSDHDSRPTRERSSALPRPLFVPSSRFCWKLQGFARATSANFIRCVPATKSDTLALPNVVPATKSECHKSWAWHEIW